MLVGYIASRTPPPSTVSMAASALRQSDVEGRRARALDGLRGLAAVSVVLLHYLQVFNATAFPEYAAFSAVFTRLSATPLSFPWAGSSAVPLFFVLSGFVLQRMLDSSAMSYRSYVARRVLRLWIPYMVVVALASVGIEFVGSHLVAGQSDWLNGMLGTRISQHLLFQHVLLIGSFDTQRINPVVWSLVLELRLSLLFPLILWAVSRYRVPVVLLGSLAIAVVGGYLQHRLHASSVSLYQTLVVQLHFVIGALLAAHEPHVQRFYARLPRPLRWGLTLGSVVLYTNTAHLPTTYSTVAGATWLIVVALCSPLASRLLCSPPIQWLGRVSYSLYLSHLALLLFLINALYPRLGFLQVVLLAVPLALFCATLLCAWVEQPAITISRIVGRRLQQGPPAAVPSGNL